MGFLDKFVEGVHSRWFLPLVLAFAFTLRLGVIFIPVVQTADFGWYLDRAIEVLHGEGYSINGVPTAFWPVGWPGALATLFSVTGVSVIAAQLVNALLGTLCCWMTALLGLCVTGSRFIGGMSALLLAIYPNQIAYVPLLSTEIFYEAILLLILLLLIRNVSSISVGIFTGILFGVATLTKTQSLVLPAVLLGWIWLIRPNRNALYPLLIKGALIYVGLLMVVAPWTYRNWTVFHSFVPVSTNGGWTLLSGNNPEADGGYTPDTSLAHDRDHNPRNEAIRQDIEQGRALSWIKQNPVKFMSLIPKKLQKMWLIDGEAEWFYQLGSNKYQQYKLVFRTVRIINQVIYFAIMIGAMPISYWLIRGTVKPASFWAHSGIAIFTYLTALTVVFSGQSRFHFNLIPLVAIYAVWTATILARHAGYGLGIHDSRYNTMPLVQ